MKKKKKEAPEMRKVQISTPVAISRAEAEIGDAVMGAARKYGLTSTWLDCALANVVVKVKEMRTAEYAAELTRMTLGNGYYAAKGRRGRRGKWGVYR